MERNEKPYQTVAWLGTALLVFAAILASYEVPGFQYAFICANSIWVFVGIKWKETTVWVLNGTLTCIYVVGEITKFLGAI